MNYLTQFLENTKFSNMRVNFTIIVWACVLLYLAMASYIIIFAIKSIEISGWSGMGIFLGGVTTSIWAMAHEKRKQKLTEQNESINKNS